MHLFNWACAVLVVAATCVASDDQADTGSERRGVRRAIIICGHPGDDEHRKQFAETVESLRTSLAERFGFEPGAIYVLFGGEEAPADSPRPGQVTGPSTQESFRHTVSTLKEVLKPEDSLWVIAIGHSHFDRRHSWFNIPGPDLNEQSFAQLFDGLTCREQVFWITIPASGFYIKPLSAPGRVIITATEADREINETVFPHELAKLLAAPPPADELDVDRDGTSSLLDLYLTLTRRIAQAYVEQMLIVTEHAQIDDNADGRGTELQRDFLSEELGGRQKPGSPTPPTLTGDGRASAQIALSIMQ